MPQQLSTYALTLYKHTATVDGRTVLVGEQHGPCYASPRGTGGGGLFVGESRGRKGDPETGTKGAREDSEPGGLGG